MKENDFVIVSGIPRSGTSMMMCMLEGGGIPCLVDGIRKPDKCNPNGYFELEAVRHIEKDASFIEQARGKVLKVISFLLYHLPPDRLYRIVFMHRKMQEVLASQRQMLMWMRKDPGMQLDSQWERIFNDQQQQVINWLAGHAHIRVLYVDYNRTIRYPAQVARELKAFLGRDLDLDAMTRVVDPKLYRQRV